MYTYFELVILHEGFTQDTIYLTETAEPEELLIQTAKHDLRLRFVELVKRVERSTVESTWESRENINGTACVVWFAAKDCYVELVGCGTGRAHLVLRWGQSGYGSNVGN